MTPPLPPPGWHPDPESPGHQRWWDGRQWTEHRAPLAAARPEWTGPPLAGFGRRLVAQLVDALVLMVPMAVLVAPVVLLVVLGVGSALLGTSDGAASSSSGTEALVGLGLLVLLSVIAVAAYALQILYSMGFEGGRLGQTPGKWLLDVRVLDARTQQPTVPSKALLRWVVEGFASGIALLGYLWMLWDDENRTWHDMAADTRVVTVEEPRVPLGDLLRSWRLRADR